MIELGSDAIVGDENLAFSFEVIDPRQRNPEAAWSPVDIFSRKPVVSRYGDWNVFPYGENNSLPLMIRNIVYANSIAPGILSKKSGLFWGQGPKLYTESIVNGELTRNYIEDSEIEAWLDTWDWEDYILKCTVDFTHIESFYTKFINKKGWRIGSKNEIAYLEHVVPYKPMVVGKQYVPTHIILHRDNDPLNYDVYPLFDKFNAFKSGQSVMYSHLYTFCSDFFSIPQILGALPWIVQSTNVQKFIEALTKNSVNIKYHITSPKAFWDQKRDDLKKECEEKDIDYKESMLKRYKRELLREIKTVLSGLENAGKFWHSEEVLAEVGGGLEKMGWTITPIEQKMRDTVQSQIDIGNFANKSAAVGVGVHSAIGNVTEEGRSGSGSEQYYALNNFQQIGVDIPEMIIMEAMNAAIKINFPHKKKIKMGFYRNPAKRQEDMNKEDRNLTVPRNGR